MSFSSILFLFVFLPVVLGLYYLCRERHRNLFLLIASLVFYGWAQPGLLWVLAAAVFISYGSGRLIGRAKTERGRKRILLAGVVLYLGMLFYFKYVPFTAGLISRITGTALVPPEIAMPLGISFYTFSGISYLTDVSRGKGAAERSFLRLALYIAFFPKLLEGPIARYSQLGEELKKRTVTVDDFAYGLERFIIGLAKKAIVADSLGAVVDRIWNAGVSQNTVAIAWFGSLAYMMQIYFDFSGYCDMAVGLGRLFGFHLPENFRLPYLSKSISEFWRRWHITLGSWFRDYVYIPLGGNRRHVYLNLAVVFLLTGLWHGASMHYVIWGMWNGLFVLLERFLRRRGMHPALKTPGLGGMDLRSGENVRRPRRFFRVKNVLGPAASHLYALLVTDLAWVLFRAPGTREALTYIGTMFGVGLGKEPGFGALWYANRWIVFVLVIAVICSTSLPAKAADLIRRRFGRTVPLLCVKYGLLLLLFYLSILRVVSGSYHAFIYFQF